MQRLMHSGSFVALTALLLLLCSCDNTTTTEQQANTLATPSSTADSGNTTTSDETGNTIDEKEAGELVDAAPTSPDGSKISVSYTIPIIDAKDGSVTITPIIYNGWKCNLYTIEGGLEPTIRIVCSECPPVCDTNVDFERVSLPASMLKIKSIPTDITEKNKLAEKYKKKYPNGVMSFQIDAATIRDMKQQGVAYVQAWPAHSKAQKPFMVLKGFDSKGELVTKSKYYRTWNLCPPVCDVNTQK